MFNPDDGLPTAPAGVLAGSDVIEAGRRYAADQWAEAAVHLADLEIVAEGIERAYA